MKRLATICTLFSVSILWLIHRENKIENLQPLATVHTKQDAPEEFLKFHRGIRTQEGKSAPEYEDNYQLKVLMRLHKANARKYPAARTESGNGVIEWKERGPANVPGRTRGLLVDPDDASHKTWFAGSASGGIWRTTDAGATWHWLTPDLPNLATTVLAMAPSNHNIIYAGTGEGFGNLDGVMGHGIFKSTDRGITWTFLESTSAMQEINRIIINPNNANRVIAASNEGIYRTQDGGATWAKVYTGVIQDLKATPGNFSVQYAARHGMGVLKSTDEGLSWSLSGSGINSNGRIEIDVSPVKTDRLFASAQGSLSGSNSDLYLSDDGGATWSLVELLLSNKTLNYLGSQGWYDNTVACDPFDKDVVYVGGIGLYRIQLTQGGAGTAVGSYSMEEVNTASFVNLVNFGANAYQGKLSIGPAANKTPVEIRFGTNRSQKAHRFLVPEGSTSGVPDANYSFASYVTVPFEVWDVAANRQLMVSFRDQDRNGLFNLYQQNTTGAATEQSREYIFIHNIPYDEAAPAGSVAVAGGHMFQNMYFIWPTLTIGGTWNPNALPNSSLRFVYSEVLKVSSASASAADPYNEYDGKNNRNFVHPDQHNIVIIKESETLKTFRLLIANDGGLFLSQVSSTPGTTQGEWIMAGNGYNTSQFYGADKRPGFEQYFGGMQDNSTYFSPDGVDATASTFYNTHIQLSGDGFEVIWNNLDGNKMIGGSQFNNFSRSLDGGKTWARAITGLTLSGNNPDPSKFPFISKLANSRQAPDILFTAGSEGVYRSTDFGGSWSLIPITAKWGLTSFIDVEVSRANANIVWAGSGMSDSRSLYVSKNGGTNFTQSKNYSQATLGSITKLASHPTEPNTAYALFSIAKAPKILRTKDLGETWEDISGFITNNRVSTNGFPDVAVYCLYVRPDNPDIIWAGTEIGIVESLNGGASWSLVDDFPKVSVWDMKGQDDQIVIATHGRGIWTAKVEADQTSPMANPVITGIGTSPKSELLLNISLKEIFDSTQVWINGNKAGKINAVAPGNYVVKVNNAPTGTITAKLISFKSTAPIHSSALTGENLLLKSIQKQYFNYFNSSNDLSLSSFSIQTFGNANTCLKTPSIYLVGTDHIALLRQPIIVSSDYPFFFYRDVAIVEPGASGSIFGQASFKDYVVVEATKDGINWTPIADGYDASFNSNWLTTYQNNQTGNATQLVDHTVNLTSRFHVGDTLLFRFRLHSDNSTTAWGWAIDDLYIQQKPTGVAEPLLLSPLQCYPNPTAGELNISYTLSEPSAVEISVHDLSGRRVYSQNRKDLPAGNYTETLQLSANGLYLVQLKTHRGVEVKKIIVRRN
jgi:photosystem II stability/assembly factor-like uncharacterized protein